MKLKNSGILAASLVFTLIFTVMACKGKKVMPTIEIGHTSSTPTGASRVPATDFTLASLDGKNHTLSSYRGKVVLVDFWASWCGPCKAMIPHAVELYNQYKNQGLMVLGVGLDDEASLRKFVAKTPISYPVLVGRSETGRTFGVSAIPTSLILDRKGNIAFRHTGFYPGMESTLEDEIKVLLAEK